MHRLLFPLALAVTLGLLAGCARPTEPADVRRRADEETGATALPEKISSDHLPNPVRVHPRVISGGLPEGAAAFEELRSLGVRTILSVDGAKPDIELARKFGMRYVHLPHGYDGIPQQRVRELAKAVRDLDGPVYIHCHHGKHRSPAAASAACVAAGLLPPDQAVAVLEVAGTSPHYRGLFESTRATRPLDAALLDRLEVAFRETVEIPPLAEAMVALESTHHHLQEIAEADWKAPANHPDLEPAHEALLLREHFTEMLRMESVGREPQGFRDLLNESLESAEQLESRLRERAAADTSDASDVMAKASLDHVTQNCKTCHQQFRDVPLSEKDGEKNLAD